MAAHLSSLLHLGTHAMPELTGSVTGWLAVPLGTIGGNLARVHMLLLLLYLKTENGRDFTLTVSTAMQEMVIPSKIIENILFRLMLCFAVVLTTTVNLHVRITTYTF